MKKIISSILLTLSTTINIYASQYICKINDSCDFTTIGWNTVTKTAKLIESSGKVDIGKVTLSRKHDEGFKVNIDIKYVNHSYRDMSEFIIFTVGKEHRVIGAGFIIKDGKKYLDISYGNHKADCLSL